MTGRHIDCQGNFETVTTDGTPESRTHNAQNQLTQVGSSTLTFDANGNMTTDETGRQFAFDAWNRLISGDSPNIGFAYDALNRRIQEVRPSETRDLFYSTDCQLLEEQVNTVAVVHYVWSPVYVDALVLRHGADSGDPQPVLYAMQDANFNVTGIVDTGGSVQERYVYDPYGAVTVLTPSWQPLTGTLFAWDNYHQGLRFVVDAGLYYNRNRDYSPTLMRFVQQDPIASAMRSTNVYLYVRNGPTVLVDPFGLEESLHDRLQQAKVEVLALQKENPQKAQIYADLIRRIEQILALDQQRALAGAQLALLERLIQIGERIEQINNEITGGPDGPEKALVPIILQRAAPKATPKGGLAALLVLNIAFACESYKELARVRALVAEGEALLAETLELQAALDAIAKDITITDVGPKGPKRTKRQRECDEKYLADVATCSATYTGQAYQECLRRAAMRYARCLAGEEPRPPLIPGSN